MQYIILFQQANISYGVGECNNNDDSQLLICWELRSRPVLWELLMRSLKEWIAFVCDVKQSVNNALKIDAVASGFGFCS